MPQPSKPGSSFSEAAREAARAANAVRREQRDSFGVPELFIVRAGDERFTWELRRFGGIVLQRGADVFPDAASAREEGEAALAVLRAMPSLPMFTSASNPDPVSPGSTRNRSTRGGA